MGGSSSTRRVEMENGIQLTHDVVDRLTGKESAGQTSADKPLDSSSSSPQQTTLEFDEYCSKKIKELEEQSLNSKRASLEEFAKTVQEVEKKFVRRWGTPVCQDLQEKVFQCYTEHHKNTLNCATLVDSYSACVQKEQQNAVVRKG